MQKSVGHSVGHGYQRLYSLGGTYWGKVRRAKGLLGSNTWKRKEGKQARAGGALGLWSRPNQVSASPAGSSRAALGGNGWVLVSGPCSETGWRPWLWLKDRLELTLKVLIAGRLSAKHTPCNWIVVFLCKIWTEPLCVYHPSKIFRALF